MEQETRLVDLNIVKECNNIIGRAVYVQRKIRLAGSRLKGRRWIPNERGGRGNLVGICNHAKPGLESDESILAGQKLIKSRLIYRRLRGLPFKIGENIERSNLLADQGPARLRQDDLGLKVLSKKIQSYPCSGYAENNNREAHNQLTANV